MEKFKQGVIIGKFMPVHAGHQHLVDTARAQCERLTVMVCSLPDEPVPGELRYNWMKELYPELDIIWSTDEVPSNPWEHPDFWNIWKSTILARVPKPDVLFSSEKYGDELSRVLGCKHVCVDLQREKYHISGTKVRADPYAWWELIPPPVRAYYARRVCIVGSESTGKTTLAAALAKRFATEWVPEYAIEYLRNGNSDIHTLSDFENIARGQLASEDAKARTANRVLFCDTDLMTTSIWSRHYLGSCPEWVQNESMARKYDLYLLTDIDIPWVESRWRDCGDRRKEIHDRFVKELTVRNIKFVTIQGTTPEERLDKASEAVRALFNGKLPCSK